MSLKNLFYTIHSHNFLFEKRMKGREGRKANEGRKIGTGKRRERQGGGGKKKGGEKEKEEEDDSCIMSVFHVMYTVLVLDMKHFELL
jgi:hypothetical protein